MPTKGVAYCEKCGGSSTVRDSRRSSFSHGKVRPSVEEDGFIYRRRWCKECRHTWSTVEIPMSKLDDYDLARKVRAAELRLQSFRKTILDLERMTR